MQPGVITLYGFFGPDDRNLIDIITEDDGRVKRMGLTHEQIGRRMEDFRDAGKEGLGEFTGVDPHFEVRVETVRGKLPSPFDGEGIYPKTNTIVRNKHIDEEIVFSDLSIHLIRDHGFYQGKGSQFRIDPVKLARVLEIEPEDA